MRRLGYGSLHAAGSLGIVLVLCAAGFLVVGAADRSRDARDAVARTRAAIDAIDDLVGVLLDAETGGRGFAVTGDPEYLGPFDRARAEVEDRLVAVRERAVRGPGGEDRFRRLEGLARERVALSGALVEARRAGGIDAAAAFMREGRGRETMEALRALAAEMREAERGDLPGLLAASVEAEERARGSLLGLLAVVGLMFAGMFLVTRRELSLRVRAEAREREARARLQAILDHSPSVIFAKDGEGRFVFASRRFHEVTGIPVEDAIGKTVFELFPSHPAAAEEYAANDARAVAEGPLAFEERVALTGEERIFLSQKFPVRDADGAVVGMAGISTDITDRKAAEEALRGAKEAAEAATRELEAFSYSVSHDLRAPLRAVDGFGLALDEDHGERLDERGRDYLRRIREGAQHMSRLIDDLIELSRISRTELVRTRVDLSALAAEVVAGLREADPGRAVEVVVRKGVTAEGDPRLLRILLVNLLGNAWKYTGRKPGARIEFGRDAREGSDEYFVRDDGVGFEMQYAGRLFSPFQRMHRREDFPGTGIGLATVHRIVARHRGTIRAEAAPGRGAEFRFTLGEGGGA